MLASSSLTVRLMTRRPKPCRSAKPGWAPIETPLSTHSFTVSTITTGSLAWKPQATLAERTIFSTSASLPITHGPKLSPRSELTLTYPALVAAAMGDSLFTSRYLSRRERTLPILRRHCLYRRIRQRNLAPDQRPGDGPARRHRRRQGLGEARRRCRDGALHALADGLLRSNGDLACRPAAADRHPDRGRPQGRHEEPSGHYPLLLRRSGVRTRSRRSGGAHQKDPGAGDRRTPRLAL